MGDFLVLSLNSQLKNEDMKVYRKDIRHTCFQGGYYISKHDNFILSV